MTKILHEYDYYIQLVLKNKRIFFLVALSTMTLGAVLAYVLPKQYEAKSTVFLEQNVITDLVKGIAVTPSVEAKIKMLSVSLLSRTMMLKVIRELNKDILLQNDRQLDEYLTDITSRTKISYQEKQGVFQITFRDRNPAFARDFVNTLTHKYIDENTASKREESLDATKFLAEQIEIFKRRIDAADEAINRFKSEKGYILATDDIFLRGEIATAEKKLEELAIKRAELEAKKRLFQERGPEPGKLAEAEAHLSELLARYTDEHPKVAAARAAVAKLRRGGGEPTKSGMTLSPSDGARMLQVEIDAYKEMEARQTRLVEDSKNLLRESPSVKTALAELVRKKENESIVYQQLVARYGQSEVSKQMELQDKAVTFRILDPAIKPQQPVRPNKPLIILGSVLVGICAGIGLILLIDLYKGGIKTPLALRDLNIPVYVVLPHVPNIAADLAQRRKDHILTGLAVGYFIIIVMISMAETPFFIDQTQQGKQMIANFIRSAIER